MRALVIDPDEHSRDALRRAFAGAAEQVRSVEGLEPAGRQLETFAPDVLVVALDAPGGDALDYLERAARAESGCAVFALVDRDRLDAGVEAMQRGADDFLWRPVSERRLAVLLDRLAERREEERRAEGLRVRLVRAEVASTLIGRSPRWTSAFAALERAAACPDSVLLAGETGTEQEEAARALHGLSASGAEPFFRAYDVEGLPELPEGIRGTLFIPALERRSIGFQQTLLASLQAAAGVRAVFAINEAPEVAAAA
jgi:DNA-binding NtrC family response regulator